MSRFLTCSKCEGVACAQDNSPLVWSADRPKLLPQLRAGKLSLMLGSSNAGREEKAVGLCGIMPP